MASKFKLLSEWITKILKSEVMFKRLVQLILISAAVSYLVFGDHNCTTKWFKYVYDSPIKAWKEMTK